MAEPPGNGLDAGSIDVNSIHQSHPTFSTGSETAGEWQVVSSLSPADLLGRGAGFMTDHGLAGSLWNSAAPVTSAPNEAPVDDWWHEVDVDPDFLDEDDRLRGTLSLQTGPTSSEPVSTPAQHAENDEMQVESTSTILQAQEFLHQHERHPPEGSAQPAVSKPEEDEHMQLHYQVHAAVAEAIKLPEPEPPVDLSGMRENTLDLIKEGLQEKNEEIQQINERIKEVESVLDKLEEVWSNRIFDADIMKSGLDTRRRRKKPSKASKPLFGRSPEGQYLRMECPSCRRDVFVNSLGFMNHCRIKHKLKFESYEQALSACGVVVDESEVPADDPSRLDILTPGLVPLTSLGSSSHKSDENDARSRFYIKKRVVVGSTTKAIQNTKTGEIETKWVVYVRGTKEDPDISKFIRKVRFFLHPPTFQPHHIVEIHDPPFQITRRGGASFPVRVQLHTIDTKARPINLTHVLHVENENTILPTQGEESIVEIDFDRITFDRILHPAPSTSTPVAVPALPSPEPHPTSGAFTSLDAAAAAVLEEEEEEEDEEEDEDDAFADGESGDEASGDEISHAPGKSRKIGSSVSPVKVSENQIMTFIRVHAEKTFPLISEEKHGKLPYSVARTHKEWYSWSLGKRKACEWQRSHRLSQLLSDRLRVHKSTREIIDICHSLQMSPLPAAFTGADDEAGGTYEQLYGAPMVLAWAEKSKNPFRKHGTQALVFCRYCGCTHLPLEKFVELEAACGESKAALFNSFTKWDDFLSDKALQAAVYLEKRLDEICFREGVSTSAAERRANPQAVTRAKWNAVERSALQGILSHVEEPYGDQETAEAIKYEVDELDANHQPHLTALTAVEEAMMVLQQQQRQARADMTEEEKRAARATRAAQRRQKEASDRERRRREPLELRQRLADIEYTKLQLQRKQKELELQQTYLREKINTGSSAAPAMSALQTMRMTNASQKHVPSVPILQSMPLPSSTAGAASGASSSADSSGASSLPVTKPVVLAVPGVPTTNTTPVVVAVPAASPKRVPGSLLLPKRQITVRQPDPNMTPILPAVVANAGASLQTPPSTPPKHSPLYPSSTITTPQNQALVSPTGLTHGLVAPPVLRPGGATPALPMSLFRPPAPMTGQSLLRKPATSPSQALGPSVLAAPRASPQAITELKSIVSNSTPASSAAPIIPLPNLPGAITPPSALPPSAVSLSRTPTMAPPSIVPPSPTATQSPSGLKPEAVGSIAETVVQPSLRVTSLPQRRAYHDGRYHFRVSLDSDDIQRVRSMVSKIGIKFVEADSPTSEILLYRLMTAFARRLLSESVKAYSRERSERDSAAERELKVLVPVHVAQAISQVPDFDFLRNDGFVDDDSADEGLPEPDPAATQFPPVLPAGDKDDMDVDHDHAQSVLELLQQHLSDTPQHAAADRAHESDAMQE